VALNEAGGLGLLAKSSAPDKIAARFDGHVLVNGQIFGSPTIEALSAAIARINVHLGLVEPEHEHGPSS
jgi:hypothetical protein